MKAHLLALFLTSAVRYIQASSIPSLDGYAFDCGGVLLGFRGTDQMVCLNGSKQAPCGNYTFSESTSVLTGHTSITGSFLAWSMDIQDGVLVSFQSDLGTSCHAVSLDWPNYSAAKYLGLKCPAQNTIPNLSYQDNHFSFGTSGDVALRSPIKFSSGRQLIRDSYGIYKLQENEQVQLYFGPQGGQPLTVLKGRLTHQGELFIQGFVPPGPCVYDGESSIENVTQLPHTVIEEQEDLQPLGDGEPYSASYIETTIYWMLMGAATVGLGIMSC